MKMENERGELSYIIKAKGMTLNNVTRASVTFDSMKQMVSSCVKIHFMEKIHNFQMKDHLAKQAYAPLRGKKVSLTRGIKRPLDPPKSKLVSKLMKPIADKGLLDADGSFKPFGMLAASDTVAQNYPFNQ